MIIYRTVTEILVWQTNWFGDQYSWKTGPPGPFYVQYSIVFIYKQIDFTSGLYTR